ncbi:hypothetical protein HAX54_051453, partial [Datura stramonium]|nr:hypothetical protein [Datura stramonium]
PRRTFYCRVPSASLYMPTCLDRAAARLPSCGEGATSRVLQRWDKGCLAHAIAPGRGLHRAWHCTGVLLPHAAVCQPHANFKILASFTPNSSHIFQNP